ncbi:murein biosynthesis integral membrane protein MurJ [Hoyosella subflava]|uniref:Integral membrane protein MviN n=1 Tax=Hoyosella subflava (strain DSM 45089 / JCM 17490 / NBRC 109087 / DQS3-9A1) TaxID=443218 RepID=F6EPF4_HOYSD|nr:murein biosynthesis integral membrane protein MurJ [Hoyosella subflava]AEF43003.1 Integral membrane protein MviN [Hoyosella subflava DQS3-9A1]
MTDGTTPDGLPSSSEGTTSSDAAEPASPHHGLRPPWERYPASMYRSPRARQGVRPKTSQSRPSETSPLADMPDSPSEPLPGHRIATESAGQSTPIALPGQPPDSPAGAPPAAVQVNKHGEADRSLMRSTGSMALPTLISRLTGFLRTLLLVMVLGKFVGDAFSVANQLPNMVAELVLGAVLAAIVVPVLVRAEREDPDGGERFTRQLITLAGTLLVGATVVATLCAPLLVTLILNKTESVVDKSMATAFAYLLLPQILFYGLTAVFAAVLNTRGIFGPGAWAPVVNNIIAIATLGGYYIIWNDPAELSVGEIAFLGVGTTLGVIAQVLVLIPFLRKANVPLRPLWGLDDRLKKFGGMALAIVVYVAISQVGLFVTMNVASGSAEGAALIYTTVWLLLQVPYGVLGVAVLTAIMPRMSRNAAAGDNKAVIDDLTTATRITMVALIPVIMFLTVSGIPIGRLLFTGGNFSYDDATVLGQTLAISAFTLVPYALVLLHLRVFYARHEAWIPNFIIVGITVVKVILSLLAPTVANDPTQVVALLHFANGAGFLAGAVVGAALLRRSLGPLRLRYTFSSMFVVFSASLVGAVVMLFSSLLFGLPSVTESWGRAGDLVSVVYSAVIIFGITYVILLKLGVPEVRLVWSLVGRIAGKVRRKPVMTATGGSTSKETRDAPQQHADSGRNLPYAGPEETQSSEQSDAANRANVSPRVAEGMNMKDSTDALTELENTPAPDNEGDNHSGESRAQESAGHPEESGENRDAQNGAHGTRRPRLMPGTIVAGGRYRLVEEHGRARGLRFWQAWDLKLERDVALTFVTAATAEGSPSGERHDALLARTLRLARIDSPGLARVLDVVKGRAGGIVISEWTPGQSLGDIARTNPSPAGAARAVRTLAGAAEAAHRTGTALSIDHPDRIRINSSGDAVLAFPGTAADADQSSDVHGLGAALYTLVTGHWPLAELGPALVATHTQRRHTGAAFAKPGTSVGGLPAADFAEDGSPVDPRRIRPEVPYEISAVALRALQPSSGIRTAATVQQILDQATMADQATDMIPVIRASQAKVRPRAVRIKPQAVLMTPEERRSRSIRVVAVLTLLAIATVLILTIAITQLTQLLMGSGTNTPVSRQPLGFTAEEQAPGDQGNTRQVTFSVFPSSVTVYSPQQQADNPGLAELAIDGDPDTAWTTSQYFQQFPAFKSGVGLIVAFDDAFELSQVEVRTDRPGSNVEIRTADSTDPDFDSTDVVATTVLEDEVTQIQMGAAPASQYILIWIDELSEAEGRMQSSINELRFTARR